MFLLPFLKIVFVFEKYFMWTVECRIFHSSSCAKQCQKMGTIAPQISRFNQLIRIQYENDKDVQYVGNLL